MQRRDHDFVIASSPHRFRRGFTLLEILVTVTIIAGVAAIVVPMFGDANRVRVMAASSLITSDIELAQTMTIASPKNPIVVKFNQDAQSYWLAPSSDPDNPMLRPGTNQAYLVVLGEGRALGAAGVVFTLKNVTGDTLEFNAQGGLTDFTSQPAIELSSASSTILLSIAPTTGTISQTNGT